MKKYNIITDGIKFRVVRLYFGFIPVVEKEDVDCEGDTYREPIEFLSFDDAVQHIRKKLGLIPKPTREWKVVWRGYNRI